MAEAMRLTFEWDGKSAALREARRVAKRAPVAAPTERGDNEPATVGMVLELRRGDHLFYRRQVGPMFPDSHEVQTGDPRRPFARAPRSKPSRVEILVPAAEGIDRLRLVERRVEPGAKRGTPP